MSSSTLVPVYYCSILDGDRLLFHQSIMRVIYCVWEVFLHLWRGSCKIFVHYISNS